MKIFYLNFSKKVLTIAYDYDKIIGSFDRTIKYADVAELADALDLGSSEETRECSSHFIRTSGEPPQAVRVSLFAKREFFVSRVNSFIQFCLYCSKPPQADRVLHFAKRDFLYY